MTAPPPQSPPPRIIAHLSLTVRSLRASEAFYTPTLGALGLGIRQLFVHPDTGVMGYGAGGGESEVLVVYERPAAAGAAPGAHIAFHAPDQQAVMHWHAAALAHGGTDDGSPGMRDYYGPGYYAAFARDPDGHRVEAVAHLPVDRFGRVDFARMG